MADVYYYLITMPAGWLAEVFVAAFAIGTLAAAVGASVLTYRLIDRQADQPSFRETRIRRIAAWIAAAIVLIYVFQLTAVTLRSAGFAWAKYLDNDDD